MILIREYPKACRGQRNALDVRCGFYSGTEDNRGTCRQQLTKNKKPDIPPGLAIILPCLCPISRLISLNLTGMLLKGNK